jgi:hypothetical protein
VLGLRSVFRIVGAILFCTPVCLSSVKELEEIGSLRACLGRKWVCK